MKTLSNTLLNTQITGGTPVVSVQIQEYGLPQESNRLRFSEFDWTKVQTLSSSGTNVALICCASDGSLVATDGNNFLRIASPTPTSDYSGFTSLVSGGTISYARCCLVAHPTSGEVFLFNAYYTDKTYFQYKLSSNYGATWGDWIAFGNFTFTGFTSGYYPHDFCLSASYKPNGDLIVVLDVENFDIYGYKQDDFLSYRVRISGSWGAWITGYFPHNAGFPAGGFRPKISSMSVSYDNGGSGDAIWVLAAGVYQDTDNYETGKPPGNPDYSCRSAIYYLTYPFPYTTSTSYIGMADADVEINSFNDITPFRAGVSGEAMQAGIALLSNPTKLFTAAIGAVASNLNVLPTTLQANKFYLNFYKDPNNVLYLFILGSYIEDIYIAKKREGIANGLGIYSKGFMVYEANSMYGLAGNANYVFHLRYQDGIYISPVPASWTYPTVGSGAGATVTPTNAILGVKEQVSINQPAQLLISYNNSNDYFDSPGTGALTVLSRGSRINLSLGYHVGDTDYTEVYARYFVDSWEYTREPDRSIFELSCVDAWGLLEKYRFNCKASFNYLGATTTYSVYQLIEMLCRTIGGSLTYANKSSFIDSFKPVLEIGAGESAANALRRLLSFIPDQIKFFGNAATIYYPQTTDAPIYYYSGPT